MLKIVRDLFQTFHQDSFNMVQTLDDSMERADILSDDVMERGISYQVITWGGWPLWSSQSQNRMKNFD